MEQITSVKELRETIARLENKQAEEWVALKEQAHLISESLQPANVSKRILNSLLTASSADKGMVDQAIGLATGIAAKKLITTGSHNPLVYLLGNLVEKIVAGTVSQNAGGIKDIAALLFRKLRTVIEKSAEK